MTYARNQQVHTLGTTLHDGTMLNAIYKPSTGQGSLVVLGVDNKYKILDHYQDKITGIDYYPLVDGTVRDGSIVLPEEVGSGLPIETLRTSMMDFIYRYLDLDPEYLNIVVDYTWNTYFFDKYEKVGYLRFFGYEDTGKSRALKVLRSISRNSYYLGSAATSANIFRIIDKCGYISLFIDEANFFDTRKTNPMTQILNEGYSEDGKVNRCDTQNYEPKSYKVFGPKIIANHTTFEDTALESRLFTIKTRPTSRCDIPGNIHHLEFSKEAIAIRNNLLHARLELNSKIRPEDRIFKLDKYNSRLREITYPLLWSQCQKDLPEYLSSYLDQIESDQRALRLENPEVAVANSIIDFVALGKKDVLLADLAQAVQDQIGYSIHPKTVNNQLRQLGIRSQHCNQGTRIFLNGIDPEQIRAHYRL